MPIYLWSLCLNGNGSQDQPGADTALPTAPSSSDGNSENSATQRTYFKPNSFSLSRWKEIIFLPTFKRDKRNSKDLTS